MTNQITANCRHDGDHGFGRRVGFVGRIFLDLPAEIDLGDAGERQHDGTVTQGVQQNLTTR